MRVRCTGALVGALAVLLVVSACTTRGDIEAEVEERLEEAEAEQRERDAAQEDLERARDEHRERMRERSE